MHCKRPMHERNASTSPSLERVKGRWAHRAEDCLVEEAQLADESLRVKGLQAPGVQDLLDVAAHLGQAALGRLDGDALVVDVNLHA